MTTYELFVVIIEIMTFVNSAGGWVIAHSYPELQKIKSDSNLINRPN